MSTRKIREILRLKGECRQSSRAITRNCRFSYSTAGEYLERSQVAGLQRPLPADLDDEAIECLLFPPTPPTATHQIPCPNWSTVHTELRRKGVALRLLSVEVHRDGYGYSQFCELAGMGRALQNLDVPSAQGGREGLCRLHRPVRADITAPKSPPPAQGRQLPLPVTLDLDLSPARGLGRWLILQLAQGKWICQHFNNLVPGPTGAGKTFLACVLAQATCRVDLAVRYHRTSRFLPQLTFI